MDLYVERQAIAEMKAGDSAKFLLLFDGYFADLYRYVFRRVKDRNEAERIVRTTFIDALGQIQNTPGDGSYLIFLYSLARPRVFEWMEQEAKAAAARGSAEAAGGEGVAEMQEIAAFEKMMGKLSFEEREILRLKFFEQVIDGDILVILDLDEGSVGQKIYRVLKRAHFLLFGESDERSGVYFGELSGLFERVKMAENIEIPEVLKLTLKTDLINRIERRAFAVEGEEVKAADADADVAAGTPFVVKTSVEEAPKGSNDPAKIFVEAVKEMKQEEREKWQRESEKFERQEKFMEFIDKWKAVLTLIPVFLFVVIVGFLLYKFVDFRLLLERGYVTNCGIEIEFEGDFSDGELRGIYEGVNNRLCDHFEVSSLKIAKNEDGTLGVSVDVPSWVLEYNFGQKTYKQITSWRVKKYARTLSGDDKSGEV